MNSYHKRCVWSFYFRFRALYFSIKIIIFNKRTLDLVLIARRINEIYIFALYLYELSHDTVIYCIKSKGGSSRVSDLCLKIQGFSCLDVHLQTSLYADSNSTYWYELPVLVSVFKMAYYWLTCTFVIIRIYNN